MTFTLCFKCQELILYPLVFLNMFIFNFHNLTKVKQNVLVIFVINIKKLYYNHNRLSYKL